MANLEEILSRMPKGTKCDATLSVHFLSFPDGSYNIALAVEGYDEGNPGLQASIDDFSAAIQSFTHYRQSVLGAPIESHVVNLDDPTDFVHSTKEDA